MRKMMCVGKKRAFDGSIASYSLLDVTDEEQTPKNFTEEYLIAAIKRHEIVIGNLCLNQAGDALIERIKVKPVTIRSKEEPEREERKSRSSRKTKSKKKTKRRTRRK